MTHREVYDSHIGATLTNFKEQMKIKLGKAEKYLAEHMDDLNCKSSYQKIILFSEQAIKDTDLISELLIEFVKKNGWDPESYHTTEELGLPKGEPIKDDGGINDEVHIDRCECKH